MHKTLTILSALCLASLQGNATNPPIVPADTARVIDIEEVVVVASPKENFKLREQPTSVSLFSQESMERLGVNSVKDLTGYARSLFIPDYGSRLTSAIYIRGIGSRINTPTVGLYLDNMPIADKGAFDFFMLDADRVDVLNGPQGTLYGHNSMGGLIRVFTTNPMRKQGTTISIGATGRTSGRRISAITRQKFSDKFALSLGGYYSAENGFFRNDSTGKKADGMSEAGARARAIYRPTDRLSFDLQVNYSYTDQDAYPYYYTGNAKSATTPEAYPGYIGKLTANHQGKFRRSMWATGLATDYKFNHGLLSSVTSWQFLQDRMFMDQDFLAADIYTLEQRQRNQAVSEELTYKTTGKGRWQSASGLFFSHQHQHTTSPVNFRSDGMAMLNSRLASVIPAVSYENPYTHSPMSVDMSLAINDPALLFNGTYRTPSENYALFHQSTIKDLFIKNLSLILGLRLDIENQRLDYTMPLPTVNYTFSTGMSQPANLSATPKVSGHRSDTYVQLLPKAALQYDFADRKGNVYMSFTKGYRSGGYNIEMCSELAQTQMQGDMIRGVRNYCDELFDGLIANARNEAMRQMFSGIKEKVDANIPDINAPGAATLRYKPEYSLNYEVGTHLNLLQRALQVDAAVFYMSTRNQQIARFSPSGLGRQMVNAGRSACCGAELGVRSSLLDGNLDLFASYGFTHSEFRRYNDGRNDYKGKHVPFVPAHNMSLGANMLFPIKNGALKSIEVGANLTGAGRIYWTEANTSWQDFYANLGAHIAADLKVAKLNLWGKNITDSKYNVFYFETMNRGFEQHSAPCRFGADLTFNF